MSTLSHINTSVRLTLDEKKQLDVMATKQGVRLSTIIRRYFQEGLARDGKKDSKKMLSPEDEVMLRLHFDMMHYLKALGSTLKPDLFEQAMRASRDSFHTFVKDYYETR